MFTANSMANQTAPPHGIGPAEPILTKTLKKGIVVKYGRKKYGKTTKSSRYDICIECGAPGHLFTYTTTDFFHVFGLPLIPRGRIKVTHHCIICGEHRSEGLKQYTQKKKNAIKDAKNEVKRSSNKPIEIATLLKTLALYNEVKKFNSMASKYAKIYPDDVDIHLAIAFGFHELGFFNKSGTAAKKAQSLGAGEEADELVKISPIYEAAEKRSTPDLPSVPFFVPYLPPLLLILSLIGGLGLAIFEKSNSVWLVNGTQSSYSILIDQKTYELNPLEANQIFLWKGKHTVLVKTPHLLPSVPFVFYNKADRKQNQTQVLNPDGAAFLIKKDANSTNHSSDDTTEYLCGKKWYLLDNIDYPFRKAPETMPPPSTQSIKYSLSLYKSETYVQALDAINTYHTKSIVSFAAQQFLRIHPETNEAGSILKRAIDINTPNALAVLEKGLKARPILTEWHRFYQSIIKESHPENDLESEYAALVQAEPNEPLLKYLHGLVSKNDKTAIALFIESEKGAGCKGFGFNAIAENRLCRGDFQNALKFARLAVKRSESNLEFKDMLQECLYAAGDYQTLIQQAHKKHISRPSDGNPVALEIRLLCKTGNIENSLQLESTYAALNWKKEKAAEVKIWKHNFQAARYYISGDMEEYLKELEQFSPVTAQYEYALHRKTPQIALEHLLEVNNQNYIDYLIVYCSAIDQNKTNIAHQALSIARKLASKYPEKSQSIDARISPVDLAKANLSPEEKRVIACALAHLNPDQKSGFYELASTFNYKPFFPYRLIQDWVDENQMTAGIRAGSKQCSRAF